MILAALSGPADNDPASRMSARWLIHFANRDPAQVTFEPPVDHDEALAYPCAIAAEPVDERAVDGVPPDLAVRLEGLLAIGAIDADDTSLCRRRYRDDPSAWDCLLAACEKAAKGEGHD